MFFSFVVPEVALEAVVAPQGLAQALPREAQAHLVLAQDHLVLRALLALHREVQVTNAGFDQIHKRMPPTKNALLLIPLDFTLVG